MSLSASEEVTQAEIERFIGVAWFIAQHGKVLAKLFNSLKLFA